MQQKREHPPEMLARVGTIHLNLDVTEQVMTTIKTPKQSFKPLKPFSGRDLEQVVSAPYPTPHLPASIIQYTKGGNCIDEKFAPKLLLVVFALFVLVNPGFTSDTKIELILLFANDDLDNYYIKYQTSVNDSSSEDYYYLEYKTCFKDGLVSVLIAIPLREESCF